MLSVLMCNCILQCLTAVWEKYTWVDIACGKGEIEREEHNMRLGFLSHEHRHRKGWLSFNISCSIQAGLGSYTVKYEAVCISIGSSCSVNTQLCIAQILLLVCFLYTIKKEVNKQKHSIKKISFAHIDNEQIRQRINTIQIKLDLLLIKLVLLSYFSDFPAFEPFYL